MTPDTTTRDPVGWILYDDSCGFCRRWIPFWESALRRRGFSVAPFQAHWVREKLELDDTELRRGRREWFVNW